MLTALLFAIALPVAAQTGAPIAPIPSSTGFESVSSGSHLSGSVLEGWTVSGSPVGVIDDRGGAHGGANYLALASGRISRTFATKPGAAYQLRYQARGFGLIDWWPGDNNTDDIIGTNNGTIPYSGVNYAVGEVNNAFNFSGVGLTPGYEGNEVDFGTNVGNFGTNDFTVDFWIKLAPTETSVYGILEKREECQGTPSMWDIRLGPVNFASAGPGRFGFEVTDNGVVNYATLGATKAINDGVFHHAAFVRHGVNLEIFLDGLLNVISTNSGVANLSNSAQFRAGQSVCVSPGIDGVDTTRPFQGEMDELDFFNRALSPAEIQAIYAAGSDGKYGPVSTLLPNLQLSIRGMMTNNVFLDEAAGPWRQFTNNFTAVKSQVTIEFEGNPLGVLLDDIEIVPAP